MDTKSTEGYDPKNVQQSEPVKCKTLNSSLQAEENEIRLLQSDLRSDPILSFLENIDSDDVPSSSGLTREDLQATYEELYREGSALEPPRHSEGGLGKSGITSSGKDVVQVEGRFGFRDDTGDGDDSVAVSPCGRYLKYSQVIGVGSVKTVFRGLDSETGVAVAWCELLEKSGSKDERNRFREEVELLKQLQHPNIVRFYSSWEFVTNRKKNYVLVTELMTSGTLKTYLKRFKTLNMRVFKDWCVQILRALQYLHSRRPLIIHRDLKCDNIFITGATGLVKIGDLGLSTRKRLSFARSVVGTPEFMAPEMYEEHYDEGVDIYAFGMCMLEMIISEYPYNECSTPTQIYKKVIMGVKPDGLDKVEDHKTRNIIEWCIKFEKQDRPTCRQLLISDYFAEKCIRLVPVSPKAFIYDPECNVIQFRLHVTNPSRRHQQQQENEAIIFSFDVRKDCSETMSLDMCNSNIISSEDARLVENIIKSHVAAMEEHKRTIHSQQVRVLSPSLDESNIETMSLLSSSSESLEPSFESPGKVELCPSVAAICVARPIKSAIRVPGLSVTNIVDSTIVYCLMENRQLTITFHFDVNSVDASKCTSSLIKHGMLAASQSASFILAMHEIIRQVKEDPTQLPSIRFSEDRETTEDLAQPPVQLKRHLTFAEDTKPPAPIVSVEQPQSPSSTKSASPRRKPKNKSASFSVSTVNENHSMNKASIRPSTPPLRAPTWSSSAKRMHVKKSNVSQSKRYAEGPSNIPMSQRGQQAALTLSPRHPGSGGQVNTWRAPVRNARNGTPPPKGFLSRLPSKPHTIVSQRKLRGSQKPTQLTAANAHNNTLQDLPIQSLINEHIDLTSQTNEVPALSTTGPQQFPSPQQRRNKLRMQVQYPKFMPQPQDQHRFSPVSAQQVSQFYSPPIDSQVNILPEPSQGPRLIFDTKIYNPLMSFTEAFYSDSHFLGRNISAPSQQTLHQTFSFPDGNLSVQSQQMQSYQQPGVISQMGPTVEELLPLSATHPSLLPMMLQSDIKVSLDNTRSLMSDLHVQSSVRQSLLLLFQRQHVEEEDLRLKHLVELEEFLRSHRTGHSEVGQGSENNSPYAMNQCVPPSVYSHIDIGDGMPQHTLSPQQAFMGRPILAPLSDVFSAFRPQADDIRQQQPSENGPGGPTTNPK